MVGTINKIMLKKILDLHIHSKYSRACSQNLELPKIAAACLTKGIDIVASGDFTHPAWFAHIKDCLEEIGESGLYRLKNADAGHNTPSYSPPQRGGDSATVSPPLRGGAGGGVWPRFILSTEVSCIYKHKEKTRRLHLVILAPNIAAVEKLNKALEEKGVNLKSDGRPIMGLSAKRILQMLLDLDSRFMLIPAHAWTPWFAIFGSKSGYDSLEECFEELTPHVRAIETGLSSDPAMNRRWSALDNITLVSNSDAHSPDRLGREANVFQFDDEADITYEEIIRIIKEGDKKKFLHTIEFYPEEGKYHFDGHLDCAVCLSPAETKKNKSLCPRCKKPLTIGVLHRVDDLADRAEKDIPRENFIPHKYIVPLRELLAGVYGVGPNSKKVDNEYQRLLKKMGSEFSILLDKSEEEIARAASDSRVAPAIQSMRAGQVKISPGYDGKFGQVEILSQKTAGPSQSRLLRRNESVEWFICHSPDGTVGGICDITSADTRFRGYDS